LTPSKWNGRIQGIIVITLLPAALKALWLIGVGRDVVG
jgi:hypothetical protein